MRKPFTETQQVASFWDKVDKAAPASCWLWQGGKKNGYGWAYFGGKYQRAHRLAYRLAYREIEAGKDICHKCDNPACVNPAHLFACTHSENMQDMVAKGRMVNPVTIRGYAGRARLRPSQVKEIRQRAEAGESAVQLSAEYGVTSGAINDILSRRRWPHVR